jgi:hypothetical protein
MVDYVGPREGGTERRAVLKLGGNHFDAEAAQKGSVTASADNSANAAAPGDKLLGDMAAKQTRGAGNNTQSRGHTAA